MTLEETGMTESVLPPMMFMRKLRIMSMSNVLLTDSSHTGSYLMLDFNEYAARQSVAATITASSESFSIMGMSTAGLLPVHQDPASSPTPVTAMSSSLAWRQDEPGHVHRSHVEP